MISWEPGSQAPRYKTKQKSNAVHCSKEIITMLIDKYAMPLVLTYSICKILTLGL
jgi:hypothetical protein